ncbi:hypothetical protein EVAR_100654_1 [Eumeta japonica]|uniref:Reverse transcriptase domain-containing protein n=1 Tax=Eumeta variegata TaxID=151549 RepID=A0A4C1ZMF8_EUMVA|nr:hypothetical protein EVAR_100654_1 [Eumeta japonica]
MDELSIKYLLYGDDQLILAASACELQEMVIKMNGCVKKRGMKVNRGKRACEPRKVSGNLRLWTSASSWTHKCVTGLSDGKQRLKRGLWTPACAAPGGSPRVRDRTNGRCRHATANGRAPPAPPGGPAAGALLSALSII